MAQEKIVIQFQATGNKALTSAIKQLDAATKKLTGTTVASTNAANANTTATNANQVALRNQARTAGVGAKAFATLRSKMLLYSFAMSLGVRQTLGFAKAAAKLEAVERAFVNLSGGAEDASKAMMKLRIATGGTMSNMELLTQANNAMVLGITENSDEMAKLFDMAQRLGRALGRDTKSSVESLITGIGRQSRLMLDNIGIIVKVDQANKAYADQLKINVDEMTKADKAQAFLNATIEAAEEKLKRVGKEVESQIDHWDRLSASWENLTTSIGKTDFIQDEVKHLAGVFEGWSLIMEKTNNEILVNFEKNISSVDMGIRSFGATLTDFSDAYGMLTLGLTKGITEFQANNMLADEGSAAYALYSSATDDATKELIKLALVHKDDFNPVTKRSANILLHLIQRKIELEAQSKKLAKATEAEAESQETLRQKLGLTEAEFQEYLKAEKESIDAFRSSDAARKEELETILKRLKVLGDEDALTSEAKRGIAELEKELKKLNTVKEKEIKLSKEVKTILQHKNVLDKEAIFLKDKNLTNEEKLVLVGMKIENVEKAMLKNKGDNVPLQKQLNRLKKEEIKISEDIAKTVKDEADARREANKEIFEEFKDRIEIEKAIAEFNKVGNDIAEEKKLVDEKLLVLQNRRASGDKLTIEQLEELLRLKKEQQRLQKQMASDEDKEDRDILDSTNLQLRNDLLAVEKEALENSKEMSDTELKLAINKAQRLAVEEEAKFKIIDQVDIKRMLLDLDIQRLELEKKLNKETKDNGLKNLKEKIELEKQKILIEQNSTGIDAQKMVNDRTIEMLRVARNQGIITETQFTKLLNDEKLKTIELDKQAARGKGGLQMISKLLGLVGAFGLGGAGLGMASGFLSLIQSFHSGGMVPNRNGGNTNDVPIMAEGGEFVMSRRAVDSVGVETMNRINKTGSTGSINVNVSGNVMTQDFVEGQLADAIKKAARRGSDFGIN